MQWQPIETAPFDTPILVTWKWSDGDKDFCVAQKRLYASWWLWVVHGCGGYECENEFGKDELTHWMPLPNEAAAIKLAERDNLVGELVEALVLAEKKLVELEHAVSGGDDEFYVEGAILKCRAVIAKAKEQGHA